ncbi:LOW QUALITY PROTEIN: uncharacterized protein Nd-acp [Temnothorax nylanderi]|uniref:LOW QUALITY PROTEIN: uncharacterized protein Nd-acp n=1 Tax=Temnothorax nylanderi TaxID=102681 RepID=UPI003A8A5138
MASLAGVRLLARNAGCLRNSFNRLRCASGAALVQMRCEQRLLHRGARTVLVVPQVKCNRGYCQEVREKPKSIKDIEERVLKAVAAYNDAVAEKVHLKYICLFFWEKFQGLRDTRIKQVRQYSHKDPLTLDIINRRVLLVLKLYDKIESTKVSHN